MENEKKQIIKPPRSCVGSGVVDFCESLPVQNILRFYIGSAMKL